MTAVVVPAVLVSVFVGGIGFVFWVARHERRRIRSGR